MLLIYFILFFGGIGVMVRKFMDKYSKFGFWASIFSKLYAVGVRIHELLHYLTICLCGLVTADTRIVIKRDGSGGFVEPHYRHEPSFFQALLIATAPLTGGSIILLYFFPLLSAVSTDGESAWYIIGLYWIVIGAVFMVVNPSATDWAIPRHYFQKRIGNSVRQCLEFGIAGFVTIAYWYQIREVIALPDPWFEIVLILSLTWIQDGLWMGLIKLFNRPHKAPYVVRPMAVMIDAHDPIRANFHPTPQHLGKNDLKIPAESEQAVVDQLAAAYFTEGGH